MNLILDLNLSKTTRNRYQVIIFIITIIGVQTKVLNTDCPPLNSTKQQPPRHQRFVLAFSNAKLKITPKIEIPYELTGSVESCIIFSIPITVTFQSKFDLITNWLKQISTTASGVSNSFTSLTVALTQLLGKIPSIINVPTTTTSTVFNSGSDPTPTSYSANDPLNGINPNPSITASTDTNNNLNGGRIDIKDINHVLQSTKFANNSRAQSRAQFYKSIEISHSSGKGCLLRAVCETAQTPLIAPNSGIIGEIVDMFLKLSPVHNEMPYFEDYFNAQTVGRNSYIRHSNMFRNYTFKDECRAIYGKVCPFSLFNALHIIPII